MLVPKKVAKDKLILYSAMIFLFLSATGFFLYKNYTLTHVKQEDIVVPALEENNVASEIDPLDQVSMPDNKPSVPEPLTETTKVSAGDFGLLEDSKFKQLQENIINKIDLKLGKTNPFVPN